MPVRDTSIEAYHDHKGDGKLEPQQRDLLNAMRRGRDYSRTELAEATGIRLASVCGRVKELLEKGRLCEAPIRSCKVTGRKIHPVFKVVGKES